MGDGIEIAMEYADDILMPQLDNSVPKVDYDNFYNSLKAIGKVDNEIFNAYVQVFNYDNESPAPKTKEPSKYCFTSYFKEKLLLDPRNFNSRSCLREFKKLYSGKSLHKRDLVHIFLSFHETIIFASFSSILIFLL